MKTSVHNVDEFAKLDLSFHLAMAMAAKNEVLNNLSSMREQTMELITKSLLLEEGMENALRGHIKILESFRQRNPVKARDAMRHHLQSFQRGYNVLFESAPITTPKETATPAASSPAPAPAAKEPRTPKAPQKDHGPVASEPAPKKK
jgi:hypothetical protein